MTSVYIFTQMNISICDHTKLSLQPYEYIWHFYVGFCQIYVLYGLSVCVCERLRARSIVDVLQNF